MDGDMSNFSRGKRAARLNKEGIWFDRNGRAEAQSSVDAATREQSFARQCWVMRVRTTGDESFSQCIFMDSQTILFAWHAYASISQEYDVVDISLYTDHPSSGVKTSYIFTPDQFSVSHPDKSRDLGRILLLKPYVPGMRDFWGMLVVRRTTLKSSMTSTVS